MVPHMLSGLLLSSIDRIFLERMRGLADVGIYSLAFNLGMVLYIFIESVRLSYAPYFNKTAMREGESAKPKFAKYTTYGFLIYSLAGAFLILFSKELISLIASHEYYFSFRIFPVIILINVFNGLYFFLVRPLFFHRNGPFFVSLSTITSAVANIVLNYFFYSEIRRDRSSMGNFYRRDVEIDPRLFLCTKAISYPI